MNKYLVDHWAQQGNHKNLDYTNFTLFDESKTYTSALIYALHYNHHNKLNITTQQWSYLIEHINQKYTDPDNNPLISALRCCYKQNINFNFKQWMDIIKKTDLFERDYYDWNALIYAITLNSKINQQFKNEHYQYIIDKMDLKNNYNELTHLLDFFVTHDIYHNNFNTFFYFFDDQFFLINFLEKNTTKYQSILSKDFVKIYKEQKNIENHLSKNNNKKTVINKI